MVMATSRRVLGYVALALISYAIAARFGGIGAAAMLFVAGGIICEGFVWMEARRAWRRRRDSSNEA